MNQEEVKEEVQEEDQEETYYQFFLKQVNKYNLNLYRNGFYENNVDKNINKILKNKDLRDCIIRDMETNLDLIKFLSLYLTRTMRTAFRCLYDHKDYFVGVDMNVNMYCVYYRDIMVLDIDEEFIEELDWRQKIFKQQKFLNKCRETSKKYNDTYAIYKSRKGYHVFVINRRFDKSDKKTMDYMIEFGSDTNYLVFTYLVGWVVRLNKKTPHDEMYEYIGTIGKNIDSEIFETVKLHFDCSKIYENELVY